MNIEKMTTMMQQSLAQAQEIAQNRKHQEIDVSHLWKVFLTQNHFVRNLYEDVHVPISELEKFVDEKIDQLPVVEGSQVQYGQSLSQSLYQLLTKADEIRQQFQDEYLATEVIVLALMETNHPIKEFLVKYSAQMKEVQNDLQQQQAIVSTLLNESNYTNDAPNFENSLKTLSDAKIKFDTDIENIKLLTSEESIMKLIENKKLSSEYVELYKKYFFSESTLKEMIAKDSSILLNTKNTVDNTYDVMANIFTFLVTNQGKWEVSNGNVVFGDFSLMAQFIALKANM